MTSKSKDSHPQWAYFKGKFVPIGDAKISIMTQVVNYGIGAFGGIRGYWNQDQKQLFVFRIKDHIHRLFNSCKLFRTTISKSEEDIQEIILELLRKEKYHENVYIRPLVYNGTEDIAPRFFNVAFEFACFTRPLGDYIPRLARVCTSSWRRVDDNSIPSRGKITGSYVNSAFARSEAYWDGYDEAIILNQDGHISEGSAMNLFIVRDGKLITSTVTDNILEGITRSTIIQLAQNDLHIPVIERNIDRSELYVADEMFLCGTGVQIASVNEIDHRKIGDGNMGPITNKIQQTYFDIVHGRNKKYTHWLTKI